LESEKLHTLRISGDEFYDEEARLLQSMTVKESFLLWAGMQASFKDQLQQSAPWFEADHRNALIELQARLYQLVE